MAYQVQNPVLVLVGAAASQGQKMFANDLFNAEMCESIKGLTPLLSEGKFDGLDAITMCQILNDRVQLSAIQF